MKTLPVVICILIIEYSLCEIRFVFEMFRHGARGPWNGFKQNLTDTLGEQWEGVGELTEIGMRQHYLLGYRNRIRYQNFISESYDPKEIYIISTDVNRTIMSAYSQLQGLFSPGTGPLITNAQSDVALPPINNTDFDSERTRLGNMALPYQMQVVPIHLFDLKAKQFNLHDSSICPNAANYVDENKKKPIVKNFYEMFNLTWGAKLRQALNITDDNYFYDYWTVYTICDTFVSDYTEGKELKIFTKVGIDLVAFNQTAYEFLKIDILDVGFGDDGYKLATMSMSPTALSIINWMDTRIENDIKGLDYNGFPSPKFVMYSAHDTNMAGIQTYIKAVFNNTQLYYTPFASSIFFELYRKDNLTNLSVNDYSVLVIYNDITLFELPYSQFKNFIQEKSYSSKQIAEFCGFPNDDQTKSGVNFFLIMTIILAVICISLAVYIVILHRKKPELPTYNNII